MTIASPAGTGRTVLPLAHEWPDDGSISSDRQLRLGWDPVPFGQYLFKVVSRRNLNCDYCCVYNLQDDSWRGKPRFMSLDIVVAAARRIAEHASIHGVPSISVVLHGGEPLLVGPNYLRQFVSILRSVLPDIQLRFTIQTNGTLLTVSSLALFAELGIVVGISIDGDREATDNHRRYPNGRSSYDEVIAAVALANSAEHRAQFAGLLCTIDVQRAPLEVYRSLVALNPPWVDLLLPHGTWSAPPPSLGPPNGATPYADWLIPIFDEWYATPVKPMAIRIFEEITSLLMGGRSRYESFGLQPVNLLVIEADGMLELVDSLKAAYNGAAATGLNVIDNALDDALNTPAVIVGQLGQAGLCDTCRTCDLVTVCGGGLYSHRHRLSQSFGLLRRSDEAHPAHSAARQRRPRGARRRTRRRAWLTAGLRRPTGRSVVQRAFRLRQAA